jgi:hypothetical protein
MQTQRQWSEREFWLYLSILMLILHLSALWVLDKAYEEDMLPPTYPSAEWQSHYARGLTSARIRLY